MKKKKIIFTAVATIAVAITYAYTEYNRTVKDLTTVAAKENITSTTLIELFSKDERSANERFLGKVIAVQGFIRDVETDEKGYLTVVLGDSTNTMSSVRCSMDTAHMSITRQLIKGMLISMKGNFTGYKADDTGLLGADAELNNCVLDNDSY